MKLLVSDLIISCGIVLFLFPLQVSIPIAVFVLVWLIFQIVFDWIKSV